MTGAHRRRWFIAVCTLALVAAPVGARQGRPDGVARTYVTAAGADLVARGLALAPPTGADAADFVEVPAPSLRNVPNNGYAQVTVAPWVESNGWRFQVGVNRASYTNLPGGAAPLAAAEAFAFNVDALLNPDPADVDDLATLLEFLNAHAAPPMSPLANIGVIDNPTHGSMSEVWNMLTRRNLLYRRLREPDPALDLNVRVGDPDFPESALADPGDFAARVREKLGDDRRLVRLFGTTTTIARLTGDGQRARLILLSYSRNRRQQDVRIRLLGRWDPAAFAPFGTPADASLTDVEHVDGATEFTIPEFSTIAIVDLTH
jgi:hypothetical protein